MIDCPSIMISRHAMSHDVQRPKHTCQQFNVAVPTHTCINAHDFRHSQLRACGSEWCTALQQVSPLLQQTPQACRRAARGVRQNRRSSPRACEDPELRSLLPIFTATALLSPVAAADDPALGVPSRPPAEGAAHSTPVAAASGAARRSASRAHTECEMSAMLKRRRARAKKCRSLFQRRTCASNTGTPAAPGPYKSRS